MKMKNSAILNVLQKNKQSSKLNNTGDKKWVHQPEALKSNHVVYLVKFLGCTEVDQPKGTDVIREGIRKLKFNQQLKKAEGAKPAKVELTVSVDGVTIQEPKSKRVMHKYPLHRISYCADDKLEKRFFSFIAKEAEEGKHVCFVFVSDKLAEEITLTIGQAFDLAYRRFLENQGRDAETRKQVILAQRKAQLAEAELIELRARLKDLAALVPSQELETYLRQKQIADVLEVSISEENLKNLQLNGDASSTNSGSHDVINLISDFDLTRPSRADSSDEGVESNASSTSSPPPPPVPPRNNASPTTGDLLGEIDQFEGASPVVGPRLENLNWSDLEDFEAPPPAATSTGNGAVVNGFANGHHGLVNGSPVKLTPPPSKNNSNPPPLPARNPVSASNSDLLSNIFNTTASSPSLPSLLSSGSPNGLSHSASSSSVVTSLHSPLSSSAVGGSSNNLRGFALPPPSMGSANPRNPFAASSGQNVATMNGSSNKGGDDPFGMGEFNSTAPQPLAKIAAFADMKDGFSRGLVIEPQNFNEFSLESLDPLRN